MKLPLPPLPSALQPKPKRPGEVERVKPIDQAKEAGIATVDWIDERTSLSRFYAIHMLLVPGGLIALIGAHLYLVARLGTTAPPWIKPSHDTGHLEERV